MISREQLLSACREHWKLSELISQLTGAKISPKSKGSSIWMECPWHSSKSNQRFENLNVDEQKGLFHCFSCGAGGSHIDAVMLSMGMSYRQAEEWIALELGLDLGKSKGGPVSGSEVLRRYAEKCHKNLFTRKDAKPYWDFIFKRGFTERDAKIFRMGMADENINGPAIQGLLKEGLTMDDLLRAGIVRKSRKGNLYSAFFKRVILMNGDTLYGRTIRSKEEETRSHLYSGGGTNTLFNAQSTDDGMDIVFVVESIFDAITVHQYIRALRLNWGVVAMLGTHGVSDEDTAEFLASKKPKEVVIIPDNDPWWKADGNGNMVAAAPGQKAGIHRAAVFTRHGLSVRLMRLPDAPKGTDANDLGQAHVPSEAFAAYVTNALPPILYRLECSSQYFDLATPGGRQALLNVAKKELATDPGIPQEVIRFLQGKTGLPQSAVKEELFGTMRKAFARKAVLELVKKGLTPEQIVQTLCR